MSKPDIDDLSMKHIKSTFESFEIVKIVIEEIFNKSFLVAFSLDITKATPQYTINDIIKNLNENMKYKLCSCDSGPGEFLHSQASKEPNTSPEDICIIKPLKINEVDPVYPEIGI